jgi:hypothetical protein
LAYSKKLKGAGFSEQQAEILAATQAELMEERLATKRDLGEFELRLEAKLAQLKAELIKWVLGLSGAQAA